MVAVTPALILVTIAAAAESLPQSMMATAKFKPIHHRAQMGRIKETDLGLPAWLGQGCRLVARPLGNIGS